jgi:hypothetical protein
LENIEAGGNFRDTRHARGFDRDLRLVVCAHGASDGHDHRQRARSGGAGWHNDSLRGCSVPSPLDARGGFCGDIAHLAGWLEFPGGPHLDVSRDRVGDVLRDGGRRLANRETKEGLASARN